MKRLSAMLALALLVPAAAHAYTVSGRFLYEDRLYDGNGYTGAVQNLPIRRAKVEVVNAISQTAIGAGATGPDGRYSIEVDGQVGPQNVFVRCITDGRPAGYEIRVVDNFVRIPTVGLELTTSQLYSISTHLVIAFDPSQDLEMGAFVIRDLDGTGVAQAFNIFDNAVDFFDWMAQPGLLGHLPAAEDFVVYGWKATGTPGNPPPVFGSNYSQQGIFIGASPNEDTDGWSDTVILHETGHWFDDLFSRSDNPGGAHFIGDNDADVLLCYGEGAATYHCAKVREWRASRLNGAGQPIDRLVSLYADLLIPPPVGTAGGLSFGYDFETGNYSDTGAPIGQRGSANETNVTSALWDLLDGPSTPDATPGFDDDGVEASDAVAWDIEHDVLPANAPSDKVTVEDYYRGWFTVNGAGFQQAGLDQIFVTLAKMPFIRDAFESDDTPSTATTIAPVAHAVSATGKVVINELDLGATDAVELHNGSTAPVDLTGWQIEVYANGIQSDPRTVYTFLPFTLDPGEVVALHEAGSPTQNGRYHVYAGDRQAFNMSWNHGVDGAVVLRNAAGTAIDFVKWRDANGVANTTPVPAGVAFTGTLDSPAAPFGLARDVHGTDTDAASDFTPQAGSLGSANHPSRQEHTLYGTGDVDLVAFLAAPGTRYGFEARGPFSASDPVIELLSPTGQVLGSNDDMDLAVRDARIDFYATTPGTYYVRVRHVGPDTDWAEYELLAFVRPSNVLLAAPSSISADAENTTDTQDAVEVSWLNAGAYDSVIVWRDSVQIAVLPGAPGSYVDHADRGLYRYEVAGVVDGQQSQRVAVHEFAGAVSCHAGDDFESGAAGQWVSMDGWNVTATHAASGTFSFTDSPAGLYRSCNGVLESCFLNTTATFGVPVDLPPGSTLEFDHICITEATYDFGILELSTDDGQSWIELRRWDESAYAEWADLVAEPTDWKHETIDLSAYHHRRVLVRFRLYSDSNLERDGWYVDNVRINQAGCTVVAVGDGDGVEPARLAFLPPSPNPVRASATMRFSLPARADRVALEIFDVQGRVRRSESLGPLGAGNHSFTFDGRDGQGRPLASGAYFARLTVGGKSLTHRFVQLGN
jgi:hypothetical protein